jgi:plastocyanin
MDGYALILAALFSMPSLADGGSVTGRVAAFPDRYLAGTVVYLKDVPASRAPRRHRMSQKAMRFSPPVLAIMAGDSVIFANDDGVDHNVFSPSRDSYDLGVFPKGQAREHVFAKAGVYTQLCRMHPEMLAYVFVGNNVHSAIVGEDGTFNLTGVPAGIWTVAIWNPDLTAPEQKVTVEQHGVAVAHFDMQR